MKIYNLFLLLISLYPIAGSQPKLNPSKPEGQNIVLKSNDGGKTWQDISAGLPEELERDDIMRDGLFANENGLYLRVGESIYRSKSNASAPFWEKQVFTGKQGSIAGCKSGTYAYSYWDAQFVKRLNGSDAWFPVYQNFQLKEIRNIFETAGGTIFIGCDQGLCKSTDGGKTWKQVYTRGWVMKIVEATGVLMATSQKGIIRSTDDGETWETVLREGGVGIDIQRIDGGFAAIVANTTLMARTVRTSYDDGKTWQPIDAGLPADLRIASIIQVDENFFCGHPAGIFKSSDKGKTWELLIPSVENKVYNLFVSGEVIYAIARSGGC